MVSIKELSHGEAVSMHDDWFEIAGPDHFWMIWRFRYLKKFLAEHIKEKSSVLEIGCGNGIVLQQLQSELQISADGCDLNRGALEMIPDVHGEVMLYNIYDLHEELTGKYDVVLLLDVLEHIDQDVDFLSVAMKHLKPNGHVIINVPALQSLSSRYDEVVGHVRRYNKGSLTSLMAKAGLSNTKTTYWGITLIPLAILRKILMLFQKSNTIETGFKPPANWVNKALIGVMKLELWLSSRWFIGTSLLGIGQKSES